MNGRWRKTGCHMPFDRLLNSLDSEDALAFIAVIEDIDRRYGPKPAPHLVRSFEEERRNAVLALLETSQLSIRDKMISQTLDRRTA